MCVQGHHPLSKSRIFFICISYISYIALCFCFKDINAYKRLKMQKIPRRQAVSFTKISARCFLAGSELMKMLSGPLLGESPLKAAILSADFVFPSGWCVNILPFSKLSFFFVRARISSRCSAAPLRRSVSLRRGSLEGLPGLRSPARRG